MVENSVRKNVTKLLIIFLFSQKINKLKHFYVVCREKTASLSIVFLVDILFAKKMRDELSA
jgi:hypothetical protein